nr:hypothetical protein [Lysinibacillus timonensis]
MQETIIKLYQSGVGEKILPEIKKLVLVSKRKQRLKDTNIMEFGILTQ